MRLNYPKRVALSYCKKMPKDRQEVNTIPSPEDVGLEGSNIGISLRYIYELPIPLLHLVFLSFLTLEEYISLFPISKESIQKILVE